MDDKHFEYLLMIGGEIQKSIIEEYRKLFSISDIFQETITRERVLLPYHINIIDELHINENAHSRILFKLLQYKNDEGEYEFLNSLLKYIRKKPYAGQFARIHLIKPLITQEKSRIDLWIRDSDTQYSIIFENKVYNAKDRETQLSRYIELTKEKNFKEKNIFIIYLSSTGQEPEEQSWGPYKTEFGERYINLSFRDDILRWLKEDILASVGPKDLYLESALEQYIDYLEGYFSVRTINDKMNMNLDNLLFKHFELDKFNKLSDRVNLLQEKIAEMQELVNHMNSFKDRLRQNIFNEWKGIIEDKFQDLSVVEQPSGVAVCVSIDERDYLIRIDVNKDNLYCQFIAKDYSTIKDAQITKWLHDDLLPEPKERGIDIDLWKNFGNNDFEKAFDYFCRIVESCRNYK